MGALLLQLAVFAFDHHPRFFLGDSASYFVTWFGGYPPDRSWTYGLVMGAVVRATHSLTAFLLLQVVCAALVPCTAALLCARLRCRSLVCWAVLVGLSLEPLNLYYARSLMTDGPGAISVWMGIIVLLLGGPAGAAWSALLFGCAAALRIALVPWTLATPAAFLLGKYWDRRTTPSSGRGRSQTAFRDALPLTASASVLACYALLTGAVMHTRPTLNPMSGEILLAGVAPILIPADFAGTTLRDPAEALARAEVRVRSLRNAQLFADHGIVQVLGRSEQGDWRRLAAVAGKIAARAVRRDPAGFIGLARDNALDYLRLSSYKAGFDDEFGLDRELPPGFLAALRAKVTEPFRADSPATPSPVLGWMRLLWWWPAVLCWGAVLVPPVIVVLLRRMPPRCRVPLFVLAAGIFGYVCSLFAVSLEVVPRYLLPIAAPLLVILAVAVDSSLRPSDGGRRHP